MPSIVETLKEHAAQRAADGLVPLPLSAEETHELTEALKAAQPGSPEADFLLYQLQERVPPGVDDAAYVKAGFLSALVKGDAQSSLISPTEAVRILGTMQGGYNVQPLVDLLDDDQLGDHAAGCLSQTLLVYDSFYDIAEKAKSNPRAQKILESWAEAEWFLSTPDVQLQRDYIVFKVDGEINTDDLSPAPHAWSRPDIPLHAQSMLSYERPGMSEPLAKIAELREQGNVIFVGDVLGTGSSRKSATNSLLWHIGEDIPFVPNKRSGGAALASKIAPIFFNTMEDAGALPIECNVDGLTTGTRIQMDLEAGQLREAGSQNVITDFSLRTPLMLDGLRAGGRIRLIIGRGLTHKAREHLSKGTTTVFRTPDDEQSRADDAGWTLAQKIVGEACGVDGVAPGIYCEPRMSTVGSQDTTGPMTRDELRELACLGFSADFVLQSFCHTAAYPRPVDIKTQHTLPEFMITRGGVALRPGDGIIHSWLNRMLLPDEVGTGGDSHTRFPLGISFPAGSGLVAFAATLGVMPLDMPESVLVRFKGTMQPGITIRDMVHAIPYAAIQSGDLTVAKSGKKNVFSGRILEVEGLEWMRVEQAFEISDASAERSASGCTIALGEDPISEYLRSNIALIDWMLAQGYGARETLERRSNKMQEWLNKPELMKRDSNAKYHREIEIDMDQLTEPLLCCPNDPDDVKPLSEVAGTPIDEVFIGSCMTNIGHYRAAGELLKAHGSKGIPSRLWIAPPTKMDQFLLTEEGYYNIFGTSGARMEVPGCSCAWEIRPAWHPTVLWSLPRRATSPTAWAMAPMSTWHLPSWQRYPLCWDAYRPMKSIRPSCTRSIPRRIASTAI